VPVLERVFPWLTMAKVPPPAPNRVGYAPDGIASLDSVPMAPFTVPPWPDFILTRATAWRVPAAAQGLQQISGTISTLPLHRWRGQSPTGDDTLVGQPDPCCPVNATIMRTVEDLILFPYAYWIVMGRDYRGFPSAARQVPADLVGDRLDDPADPHLTYAGTDYAPSDVIRFHSPTPGLLFTGREVLRTAFALEKAVQRYANEPYPSGYLKNTGAVDLEDEEIDELLDGWAGARNARATAYLGGTAEYVALSFNAEQLQLNQGRQQCAAEIAELLNLPPRYVNAPQIGASLTYSTIEGQRRDLVDLCLSQYMAAMCSRLSLDDVTAHGQEVRFDLSAFYRSDLGSLVTTGATGVGAGLFSVTEWRRFAGLPDEQDASPGASYPVQPPGGTS
jgi:hypothetical protein